MDDQVKEITPEELLEKLESGEDVQIIDVREVEEWNAGHIRQAKLIPLHFLPYRMNELNKTRPVVMVCHSGGRSYMATRYLSSQGFDAVNMVGGMMAWPGEIVTD